MTKQKLTLEYPLWDRTPETYNRWYRQKWANFIIFLLSFLSINFTLLLIETFYYPINFTTFISREPFLYKIKYSQLSLSALYKCTFSLNTLLNSVLSLELSS